MLRNEWEKIIEFKATTSRYQQYILGLLFLIYVNNQACRFFLNYLYAYPHFDSTRNIGVATHLDSEGYGILIGFGFTVSYLLTGICVTKLPESKNRMHILVFGMMLWNGAMLIMGVSRHFGNILLSRILLGIGQATCAPVCFALIAHYFPDHHVHIASGVFVFAIYVGNAASSLLMVLVEILGWRFSCYMIAACGIFLTGLVLYTIEEPPLPKKTKYLKRIQNDKPTVRETFNQIRKNKVLFYMFFAGSFRVVTEYTMTGFLPIYYMLHFHNHMYGYLIINACIICFGGILSSHIRIYISNKVEDYFITNKNIKLPVGIEVSHYQILVLVIGALIGVPAITLVLFVDNIYASLLGLFIYHVTTESWYKPFSAIYVQELSKQTLSFGKYFFSVATTIFGSLCCILIGKYMHHDLIIEEYKGAGNGDDDVTHEMHYVIPEIRNIRKILSIIVPSTLLGYAMLLVVM